MSCGSGDLLDVPIGNRHVSTRVRYFIIHPAPLPPSSSISDHSGRSPPPGCDTATVVDAASLDAVSLARGDQDADANDPNLLTCQRRFPGRYALCCNLNLQAPGDEQLSCHFSGLLPTGLVA